MIKIGDKVIMTTNKGMRHRGTVIHVDESGHTANVRMDQSYIMLSDERFINYEPDTHIFQVVKRKYL